MLNKTVATGLLLSGLIFSVLGFAPAAAQSALAQQSGTKQSATQPSTKTPTAKTTAPKPAAAKTTAAPAKKSPPKPLVYIMDNRNPPKSADAETSKPTGASVKKASDTTASKSAGSTAKASTSPKPVSADLTKAFQQNCPSVSLTEEKSKAGYNVTFEREPGSKGVKSAFGLTNAVHKTSKIEVMNKSGKELFSETGHSTGQLVKDACTVIGTPVTKIAKN
jgi:hypothetical protein